MCEKGLGYYDMDRPEVAALVPRGSGRVLDVGCGGGRLGRRLKDEGRASAVDGVESYPAAAATAAEVLDEVIALDLESDHVTEVLRERRGCYDVIVLADVLEHLRDPWRVLPEIITTLQPGGLVVASIPNVRVASVVLPLLLTGRFDYRDRGVLDRTHLRFFTRSSAVALLEGAGLEVERVDRSVAWWRRGWRAQLGRVLGDLGAEQFLISARKPR